MTLILTLPPEKEVQILEDAKQAGMTLEEYALRALERPRLPHIDRSPAASAERAERLRRWARGHSGLPHLSDEEISREAIYSRDV